MKKPYLLIVGFDYYPSRGTGDWIKCFETEEEALLFDAEHFEDRGYDWKEVIDLRKWTE